METRRMQPDDVDISGSLIKIQVNNTHDLVIPRG